MADFSYSARDAAGTLVSSRLTAVDRKEALRKIRSRGLTPIKVTQGTAPSDKGGKAGKSIAAKLKSRRSSAKAKAVKVGRRHVLPFLKNFQELYKSGLPIAEALRILHNRIKDPAQHAINKRLLRSVQEGRSFSDALTEFGPVFEPSTINLIGAGEVTGSLHEVLGRLIEYRENQRDMRSKVVTSLVYPGIILLVAFGVVLFFLFGLMPRLQSLFDSLGGQLPFITKALIGTADFLIYYGPFILAGLVVVLVGTWRWYKTSGGRLLLDRFFLRLPLVGNMIIFAETTRITQTLGLLLENGVTTVESFKLTERTIGNAAVALAFKDVRQKVLEGVAVSKALESMALMPDIMIDLISVGENTGNLVPSFYEVSKIFQKKLALGLSALSGVISMGALFFAFLFVAMVVFGIVAAVFSVSSSLGQ